jgi:hypothetical protein
MRHRKGVSAQRGWAVAIVPLLLALSIALFHDDAHADDPLCLNSILTSAPAIDGTIATDQGWAKAMQYAFSNGTTQPDAIVQMTRDASKVYFSFDVANDPEFNDDDVIVLLVGPNVGDATQDRRIHIYPVSNSGNGSNSLPRVVKVWNNSTTWATRAQTPDATNPSWVVAKVTAGSAGSTVFYRVEVALDISATGLNIPTSATQVKLQFNVLRLYRETVSNITDTKVAGQLNWPSTAAVPGVPSNPTDAQLFGNPARSQWGDVNLMPPAGGCQGVRVKSTYINAVGNSSVLTPPPVGGSATNNYFIQIENAGSVPAGHVLATIQSGRFGIVPYSTFGPVPATPSPLTTFSTGASALTAGDVRTIGPAAWTLTRAEFDALKAVSNYVCSLVQLDVDNAHTAGVSRTLIANRYFYWNTHFGPASVFEHSAVLDTKGFAAPSDASGQQRFDLLVVNREFNEKLDAPARTNQAGVRKDSGGVSDSKYASLARELSQVGGTAFLDKGAKFFSQSVCGFRHTGRYMKLEGASIEIMDRAPCYAYWIYHVGAFQSWRNAFTAPGLEKRSDALYAVSVPVGQSTLLATRIEAQEGASAPVAPTDEGRPWWVWLLIVLVILALFVVMRRRKP